MIIMNETLTEFKIVFAVFLGKIYSPVFNLFSSKRKLLTYHHRSPALRFSPFTINYSNVNEVLYLERLFGLMFVPNLKSNSYIRTIAG